MKYTLRKFRKPLIKQDTLYLLSDTCNNGCKFCFITEFPDSDVTWEDIKDRPFDKVYLSGGEPFMRKDIYYKALDINSKKLFIFSNGNYLDREFLDKASKKFDEITLSLNTLKYHKDLDYPNLTTYYKVFINVKKYCKFIRKIPTDSKIIVSYTFPSKYGENFEVEKNVDWDTLEYVHNNFETIRYFEPKNLRDRIHSWQSPHDLYDASTYYPYKRPYELRLDSCDTCEYRDDYEKCEENVLANKCKRIDAKCYQCEVQDLCLLASSNRYDIIDVDALDCDAGLIPLIKYGIEKELGNAS
jgi:organic radical activating enzyme